MAVPDKTILSARERETQLSTVIRSVTPGHNLIMGEHLAPRV